MKFRNLKIWINVIILLTILAVLGLTIASICKNDLDILNAISSISSFFVAILTALYVITTSKQIDVANKQLEEMKMERITKEQPLLSLVEEKFTIESPNFYYAPPDKKYSIQSRYNYKLKLKNDSNSSAVLMDLEAELLLNLDGKVHKVSACNKRINTLAAGAKTKEINFLFVNDNEVEVFSTLRDIRADRLPILKISLLYKNLNGGCFKIQSYATLIPPKKNKEVLRAWQKIILSAKSDSKEIVQVMEKMNPHDDKRNKIFKDIRTLIKNEIGDNNEIEINIKPIDELYSIGLIDKEDYEKEIATHGYPHFIYKGINCIYD